MMIDRRLILALITVLGLALPLFTGGAEARNTVVKLGTLAPEGTPWFESLRDMGEEWERVSNGSVRIRIYPGGIAGDEPDMVRKMRIGQLQAAALTGVGLGNIGRDVQALQMPLMFKDDAELNCVRDRVRGTVEGDLAKKGFVVLTWGDAGWARFFSTKPIAKPDDLKGRKIFFWSNDDKQLKAWRDWGTNPVSMSVTDVLVGLQSGLIDTIATTPLAALSYQWFPLAPNMTELRLAPLVGAVVISKRTWNRIPKNLHGPLKAAAETAGKKLRADSAKFEVEAIAAMRERGLTVVPVSKDDVAAWERTARGDFDAAMSETLSASIVKKVGAARNVCRGQ